MLQNALRTTTITYVKMSLGKLPICHSYVFAAFDLYLYYASKTYKIRTTMPLGNISERLLR